MSYSYYASQIDIARKRFYDASVKFDNFKSINEDDLKKIKKLVNEENKNFFSKMPTPMYTNHKADRYLKVLRYLGTTHVDDKLPTFDAKIIFLIEALDPNLEIYKCYLKHPLIFSSIVRAESDAEKKKELQSIYDKQMGIIESDIRLNNGFYDTKLLYYEIKYFKAIKCRDKLLTDINHDFFHKLGSLFMSVRDFSSISDEENEIIILLAEDYWEKYKKPSVSALAFQLLWQKRFLGLSRNEELIIFFILVMDKDLRLLDIYNEESTWLDIEKRALEEVGFFNKDLVILEKMYQERFVPQYIPWDNKREIKINS